MKLKVATLKHPLICLLFISVLSACGGGSGGGDTGGDDSGGAYSSAVSVEESTVTAVITRTMWSFDKLAQLSDVLTSVLQAYSPQLPATADFSAPDIKPCPKGGDSTLTGFDLDSSGALSSGDLITVSFNNCTFSYSDESSGISWTGSLELEISDVSSQPSVSANVSIVTLTASQQTFGGNATVSGSFSLETLLALPYRIDTLSLENRQELVLTYSNGVDTYTRLTSERWRGPDYQLALMAEYESSYLGYSVTLKESSVIGSPYETPEVAPLSFVANGVEFLLTNGRANEGFRDGFRLIINGEFNPDAPEYFWRDFVLGPLFFLPAGY